MALVWSPRESTDLKLLYGTAFRAPNAYELYYTAGDQYKSNPDIDPERITTYEVVLEQELGSDVRLTATGFNYRILDMIDLVQDPADDMFMYDNAGRMKATGAELELAGKWKGGYQAVASWSYQEARDEETGEIVANSPRHLAKARVLVPLLPKMVFLGAEARYASARKTVTGGEVGIESQKVRFEVNLDPVRRSGLVVSSKLLSLAKTVHGSR